MIYLDLSSVELWKAERNVLKSTKEVAESCLRDRVAEFLMTFIEVIPGKNAAEQGMPKSFSYDQQKRLKRVKDRLVYSYDDIVQLSDDDFKFIQEQITKDGWPSTINVPLMAICEMLENAAKEEELESELKYKAYIESAAKKSLTVREFYEAKGVEIVI